MSYEEITIDEYKAIREIVQRGAIHELELDKKEWSELFEKNPEVETFQKVTIVLHTGDFIVRSDNPKVKPRYNIENIGIIPNIFSEIEGSHHGHAISVFNTLKINFGIKWIISILSNYLSEQYSMTYPQAKAMVRKIMGYKLDSTARTHLHQLKKKVLKYKPLIYQFETVLLTEDELDSFVNDIKIGNYNLEKSPGPKIEFDEGNHIGNLIKMGALNLEKVEGGKINLVKPNSMIRFSCKVCKHEEVIDTNKEKLYPRMHHDEEMQMMLLLGG